MTQIIGNIKILVADDHKIIRDGIVQLLDDEKNFFIIGEAGNGKEALDILEQRKADIVIMDINMPEMNGIECTRQVVQKYPETKVLALTMYSEDIYLKRMLDAGASGYILKSSGKEELLKAIKKIMAGHLHFSDEITHAPSTGMESDIDKSGDLIPLTGREKEVLKLIVSEFTNQEIAEKLFISSRTVDAHRRNLIAKTGVRNTAGLVKYAIRNKVV